MAKGLLCVLFIFVGLACGLFPLTSTAGTIVYEESFTAAGTVNGTPFDGTVTFMFRSDTTLVFGDCEGTAGMFCTPNGVASFSIQGIGAGQFTDPFFVFDNQNIKAVGFSDAALEDVLDLGNATFANYNLKSAIGPLNSTTYSFTDTGQPLGSSLGDIVIDSVSGTPRFTAVASNAQPIPEPASFTLFGSGVVGLAAMLRRKLRL